MRSTGISSRVDSSNAVNPDPGKPETRVRELPGLAHIPPPFVESGPTTLSWVYGNMWPVDKAVLGGHTVTLRAVTTRLSLLSPISGSGSLPYYLNLRPISGYGIYVKLVWVGLLRLSTLT